MANHLSSKKRIRQTDTRSNENKYYAKTARNAIKKIRTSSKKDEAAALLPKVEGMLDRLAKKKVIHKNKAANLKSSLVKHVNGLK